MQTVNQLQIRASRLDRRTYAILTGILIGIVSGAVGLLVAVGGPIIAVGAVLGLLAGLYVLTNVNAALYAIVAVMALLPFGTFPFRIGFTPTLLDAAFGAFIAVYLAQFMTGRRRGLKLTPAHGFIAVYIVWLILSFILGLRWAQPTSADLRQFAETLLSIGMVFVLVDLVRDRVALRRVMIVFIAVAGVQAIISLVLYGLGDQTAERILIRLARIGYPDGGVIRYIEDNPALNERAIGTWVDPNALGGFLAIAGTLIAPQLLARHPVFRPRWLIWMIELCIAAALLLTFSRASLLAFALGVAFIGLFRGYRRYLLLLAVGLAAVLFLPQTQDLVTRFVEAFTARDLATQMRLGEYGDSLELVSRYPITGIGFTGTPSIDLYSDVASMYLIMANQIGLVGVAIFLASMLSVLAYGIRSVRRLKQPSDDESGAILLGAVAALITALANGVADLYFFRTDFQSSITLFWLIVGLCLAASAVVRQQVGDEVTVESTQALK